MSSILTLDSGETEYLRTFDHRLELALYVAYREARCGGKRKTHDEHNFELNEYENLRNLKEALLDRTYVPGRSRAHIIFNPVIREIFAASFRDRVVHHLVFDSVYDWWDRRFIEDSYSCRIGKGTLKGIKRLDHHIRCVSENYAKRAWVMKADLQGYFMSLPRRELYKSAIWGLDRQFAGRTDTEEYRLLKFLWRQVIMDDPVKGAVRVGNLKAWDQLPPTKSLFNQPPGKGIVIGNLTSQLLSNIYLDALDRFVKFDLGYKHYGRYVDDFFIVVTEDQLPQLKRDMKAIEAFLERKQLVLHPTKRSLQPSDHGIPFLGAVVYNGFIVPGRRVRNNMYKACQEVMMSKRPLDSITSYDGHMAQINSYKTVKEIFERVGWDYLG